MGKSYTKEQIEEKLYGKYGEEFKLVGEYINTHKNTQFLHNKCNTIITTNANDLINHNHQCDYCKSMSMNIIGKKFGRLTVIKEAYKKMRPQHKNRTYFECECDCGKTTYVSRDSLSGGRTKSCGCYKTDRIKETQIDDLTGKTFGRLLVIEYSYSEKNNSVWKCLCECGNITYKGAALLNRGEAISCGCFRKEQAVINGRKTYKDLTGKRFGMLTVLGRTNDTVRNNGDKLTTYSCKCDCGNVTEVIGYYLSIGWTKSCGCLHSSYSEIEITNIVSKLGLETRTQYKFNDCRDINLLPFDVAVFRKEKLLCIIEYDGEGHYYPVHFGGMSQQEANKVYERTIFHDEIKNRYCKENGIKLLRIPYYEKKDMEKTIANFINSCLNENINE